jgi:hypothetical protein
MNPAAEDGWVLTREAVRVIARLDGETLRSAADIPPKAEVKLIEAARAGRIRGRGVRYTPGSWKKSRRATGTCATQMSGGVHCANLKDGSRDSQILRFAWRTSCGNFQRAVLRSQQRK